VSGIRAPIFDSVLLIGIFLVGCSGGEPESDGARRVSAQVLSSPPEVIDSGHFDGEWHYSIRGDEAEVDFTSERSGGTSSVSIPGATGILAASARELSGTRYLVVCAIGSQESISVLRMHDTTGDGMPDASTLVELFDSDSEPLYVTSLAWSDGGRLYMLDRRCQDIRLATDSDSDGWPDVLRSIPYAKSDDYAQLLDTFAVVSPAGGTVDALTDWSPASRRKIPYWQFVDSDLNGVADGASKVAEGGLGIAVKGMPFDGQSAVEVAGEPGRTVELWSVDSAGDNDSLLGSTSISSTSLDYWVSLTVSPSLQLGATVRVQYENDFQSGRIFKVVRDWPQILGVGWLWVEVGDNGGTVEVEGLNFTSDMTIRMATISGNEYTLSTTFIDSENATGTIPSLSETDRHNVADFWVCVPGQPEAEQHTFTVQLCPPEESSTK